MGSGKRNSKRHRRDPIRRPIPLPRAPSMRRRREDEAMMPTYEHSPVWARLYEVPVEQTPLYAVLAVLHQALSGRPVGSCVLSCHQVSGALRHLGFDAEPIAAHARLYRTTVTFTEESDIGVWKRPPVVRTDGTTTGHMVVLAWSFGQLVDPTLVQDPTLLARAASDPIYSIPVCAPVPTDLDSLLQRPPTQQLDHDLHVSWLLQPEWTAATNAVLDDTLKLAATLGALSLATQAVDVLQRLSADRDLTPLGNINATIGALLAGERQLPALPTEVPPQLRDI
jgi:hypothetical protein